MTLDEGEIACVHVSLYARVGGVERGRLCEVSLDGWHGVGVGVYTNKGA